MKVKIHLNKLLLKQKFTIGHGSYDFRDQLVVELIDGENRGFGETVAIDYYGINIDDLYQMALYCSEYLTPSLSAASFTEFYDFLETYLPESPFLRCAFDCAFYDLQARKKGGTIRDLLGIEGEEKTISSVTIGISDSEESIKKMLDCGWPMYKIKVNEKHRRQELMKVLHDAGIAYGIDANGSLGKTIAEDFAAFAVSHGATYLEQLISGKTLSRIDIGSKLPHFLDESITDLASAKSLYKECDGFVVKLIKCGGITPVLDLIKYAKSKKMLLLAGCMTESSIGINHMLELLPLFDHADLDGAFLISNDEEIVKNTGRKYRRLSTDGKFYMN